MRILILLIVLLVPVSVWAASPKYIVRNPTPFETWTASDLGWGGTQYNPDTGYTQIETNTATRFAPDGSQTIKLGNVSAGGLGQTTNYNHPLIDLSDSNAVVQFWVYFPNNMVGGNFSILLGTGGGFTNFISKSLTTNYTLKGWQSFSVSVGEFAKTGTPVMTNFNAIRLKCTSPTGVVGYCNIGQLTVGGKNRPKIVVSFDDGMKQIYDNRTLFTSRNIKPTIFVITNNTQSADEGSAPTVMTSANLTELYNLGWDISNHTDNHKRAEVAITGVSRANPCVVSHTNYGSVELTAGETVTFRNIAGMTELNGNTYTVANPTATSFELQGIDSSGFTAYTSGGYAIRPQAYFFDRIANGATFLNSKGFTRSKDFFAYPGGMYGDTSRLAVNQAGVKMGRTTQNSVFYTFAGIDPFKDILPGVSFDSGSNSVSQVQAYIDNAILRGASIILYGHGIVAASPSSTEITVANLTTILDYLVTKRDAGLIDVVPLSEFYKKRGGTWWKPYNFGFSR